LFDILRFDFFLILSAYYLSIFEKPSKDLRGTLIKSVHDLSSALDMGSRELVALVGGGGKTSLLLAMADERVRAGKRVVTTTTTKMWHREAGRLPQLVFTRLEPSWRIKLNAGLQSPGQVFLARNPLDSGKVEGIEPSMINEIYGEAGIDDILVEADGASGRPVKAPAEHEPVIPSSATLVVAMLGLDALWAPIGPEVVFRVDLFATLTGTEPGQRITPVVLSGLFSGPEGLFKGSPESARRMVFLNKCDLLKDAREAENLAGLILEKESNKLNRVVIGSILKGEYRKVQI
jgi:probable selenium-dependent hydroxylase accessory protein YqeC